MTFDLSLSESAGSGSRDRLDYAAFVISYTLLKNISASLKSGKTQTAPSTDNRVARLPVPMPINGMPTLRHARASQTPSPTCAGWAASRILDRSSHKSQIPCTALDQNLIGFPRNEPTKIDANARIQPAPCFSPTRCWVGRSDRQLVQSDERFGQVARNQEILIYYLGLALIPVSERVDVKKPNYWAGKAILHTQKAPAPVLRADHTAESLFVARALSRRTEDDPTRNHDDQASQDDQLELM